MKWLTRELIKKNSRIEVDDEDDLIDDWGESAEQQVLNDTDRTYEELVEMGGGTFPTDLVHASLLLADTAYNQRSAVDKMQWYDLPYGYERLVKPYMRLSGSGACEYLRVVIGSDEKIGFSASLPDGLKMQDVGFEVKVYNSNEKDKELKYDKDECVMLNENEYAILLSTEEIGVGMVMLSVTFEIPDTDYASGFRKQIVKINPKLIVTG